MKEQDILFKNLINLDRFSTIVTPLNKSFDKVLEPIVPHLKSKLF